MALHKQDLQEEPRYIKMQARYSGECHECDEAFDEGDTIVWDSERHIAYCSTCGEDLT